MAETTVYLVPERDLAPGQARRDDVVRYLESRGVLEGFYDEEEGWLGAGPRSSSLFPGADDPAFEYAIVYEQPRAHFVPDSHSAGYGATCASCGADLDESLYDLLTDGDEEPRDAAALTLKCPNCAHSTPLSALNARVDTAVTRFYVNFCVVDGVAPSAEILGELERLLGVPLRVLWERM